MFWKLFLGFTLVNLATAVALVSATWAWQKDEAIALTQREVDTAAVLLSEVATTWALSPTAENAKKLDQLAAEANVDVAVTSASGEKHQVARNHQSSPTTRNIRAVKALMREEDEVGALLVQRPRDTLQATLAKLWRRYALYAPLVSLVMVAAGYGLVAHLVGPVRALNRAATAMANGAYDQRAFVANRDELGVLARSFNRLSEELGERIGELQESDRRQATVLGGMIEGVVAIDDRGRVLLANAAAGKLFGFLPPQVIGRPLIEVVRNQPLHEASKTAIAARTPQRLEIAWDDLVLSVQVTPLVGEPGGGAVVVLHDTTELRRLENLRRDFVANVSHELKTPLSTIKANAETLLRGAIDDKEHRLKFLEGIGEQSERLTDLIQDMLNLARIESAQQPFEIHAVSVADAVGACLRDYEQRAEAKQIALDLLEPNGSVEAMVKADREGLRVILNNLVDNAIKYTPPGGNVCVTWRFGPREINPMVAIEVADNGSGIPDEKLSRVFERFYRVDEARSRHLGGTGLGLSIVKHLCHTFGGSVSVTNGDPQGATFTVTLPAA